MEFLLILLLLMAGSKGEDVPKLLGKADTLARQQLSSESDAVASAADGLHSLLQQPALQNIFADPHKLRSLLAGDLQALLSDIGLPQPVSADALQSLLTPQALSSLLSQPTRPEQSGENPLGPIAHIAPAEVVYRLNLYFCES